MKKPKAVYVVRAKGNGECLIKDCHNKQVVHEKSKLSVSLFCSVHIGRVMNARFKCG